MDWSFLDQLSHGKPLGLVLTVIAGILAVIVAVFKYMSDRRADAMVRETLTKLNDERAELARKQLLLDDLLSNARSRELDVSKREKSITSLREAVLGSDEELWRMYAPLKPSSYDDVMSDRDPPVIMVANSKGGVGKTTICTNLVAHFSKTLAKRVLVIDLDHQGSLSNMFLSACGITDVRCDVAKAIDPSFSRQDWKVLLTPLDRILPGVDLISAAPELAPAENKILLNYLLQEPGPDCRYLLAELLNQRSVRQTYSLVVLDCPPRLTPAMINGLCAATHVLVPTVLDRLSAEQVGVFVAMCRRLKAKLNPSLDLLGAVGVMTDQVNLKRREGKSKAIAERQMNLAWPNEAKVLARHIPHKAAIQAAAGGAIAYLTDRLVASWFAQLGSEIIPKLGLGTVGDLLDENTATSRTASHLPSTNGGARPVQPR